MVKSKHRNHNSASVVNMSSSASTRGQGTLTRAEARKESGEPTTHDGTRVDAKARGLPNTAADESLLVISEAAAGNSWRRTAPLNSSKRSGVSSPPHPHRVNIAGLSGAVSNSCTNNSNNTNTNTTTTACSPINNTISSHHDSVSYIEGLDVDADVSSALREDRDDEYMYDSSQYDSDDHNGRTRRAERIGCLDMFCSCVEIIVELLFAFDGTNAAMHTSGGAYMGGHEATGLRGSSEEMTRRLHNRNDRVNSSGLRGRNQEYVRSGLGNVNVRGEDGGPNEEGENTYVSRCPSRYPNTAVAGPLERGNQKKAPAKSTVGGAGTTVPSSPTDTIPRGSASKEQGVAVAVERTALVGREASSSAKPPLSNLSIYLPSSPLPLTSSPTSLYPNNQSFALLNLPPRQSFYLAPNATGSIANASSPATGTKKFVEGSREREAVRQREASFSSLSKSGSNRPSTCSTTRPKEQERNRTESSSASSIKCSTTQHDQNQGEIFPSADFTAAQSKGKKNRVVSGGTHDFEMNSKKAIPKAAQSRKPPREEGDVETEGGTSAARAFAKQPISSTSISVASAQERKPLMLKGGAGGGARTDSFAEGRRGASAKDKEAIFRLACEDADL